MFTQVQLNSLHIRDGVKHGHNDKDTTACTAFLKAMKHLDCNSST